MRVNVYVEEFYQDYLEHGDLKKCVSEITAYIKKHHIPKEHGEDMRQMISSWDVVKRYVHPALLSKKQESGTAAEYAQPPISGSCYCIYDSYPTGRDAWGYKNQQRDDKALGNW